MVISHRSFVHAFVTLSPLPSSPFSHAVNDTRSENVIYSNTFLCRSLSVCPFVCLRLPASPCAESAKRKYPFTFLSLNVAFVIFRFFSRRIMMREARDTPTAIFFVYHLGRYVQHKHTNVILVVHLCVWVKWLMAIRAFFSRHIGFVRVSFLVCSINSGEKNRVANGLSAIVMVYNHHQRRRQWPVMARTK